MKNGITSGPFNLESLQRIAEMFGISPSFSVIKVGDSRLAVDSESAALIQAILSEVRRRISHYGVTSVQHVAKALDPTGTLKWHDLVRRFLPLLRGLNWLDDSCEWFWSPDIPRNPIVSRMKKVFMVTGKIDIEELRSAVLRDPRTQEIDLPLPIFERFCRNYSTCLRVDNGTVSYASDQLDGELSESEIAVFVALRDKTHALRRSDLKRICATVSDGSEATFNRTIGSSPIIKSLGEGYYTLVGREARPMPDIVEAPPRKTPAVVKYELVTSELAGHNSNSLFSDLNPVAESFLWNAAMRLLARAHGLGLMASRNWGKANG